MRSIAPLSLASLLAVLSLTVIAVPLDAAPANQWGEPLTEEWIPRDRSHFVKRNGANITIFEHAATQSKLEYVSDSGICEMTKGVKSRSGYLTVGDNMNMWFWNFDARKDPETAPLVAWFNGGPGCSSMIGLMQEHGPCAFNKGVEPENNTYSWNNYANMIYIDQPIGTGFSYGTNLANSSATASPYVWKLLQNFYSAFPQYKSREFGIYSESYGGHYVPEFTSYILQQNKAIDEGKIKGEKIKIVAIGINNGWTNPYDQYKAMIDFGANNTYKKLISAQQYTTYTNTLNSRCKPQLEQCWKTDSNYDCQRAMLTCKAGIESPMSRADFNVYDVRHPQKDPLPPETYLQYLARADVMSAIGAKKKYEECPIGPNRKFAATGDDSRNFQPVLQDIVKAGVQVLIWAGDTDWICNWMGNLATANSVKYPGQTKFVAAPLQPYTVNGKKKGEFKQVDNLAFLKIFEAGHEAAYYQPEASLQAFVQTMQRTPLKST
ncbi:carboxypeptidase S1 [Venturia nashicola]|uniref:Carboxypeptidase n=1 Tax=Venturia nashicola TaxID=86259 RepID=A0A4Z1P9M5_9PEZI|nr:carboxypeptidase S1 [Venturia nashicola]TLD29629.1 carboxypeptidase S1 [Venturia nashicola]